MSYTVVSGDTGSGIAAKEHISFSELEKLNPGVNWNELQVGEKLRIHAANGHPTSSTTYKVESGDTGAKIASKHNVSFSALESANQGLNWNDLKVGETIKIPSGGSSSSGNEHQTPLSGNPVNDDGTSGDSTVRHYSGPAANFPSPSKWQKWSLMWPNAAKILAIHDTPQQISFIENAITAVAKSSGIDRRVILCTILQESHGNVHVPTTVSPAPDFIRNPGIMQTHNGAEFNEQNQEGSILQMIKDGVEGTKDGDGIMQTLKREGNIYGALRAYNSGSVNKENLSSGVGTPSYVSDIANRLCGAQPN